MTDGYDPDFLDSKLPLPRPAQVVRRLEYPRFTVLLDPERRLAAVTAVNIDGSTLRDLPRTGEWRLDDRIPAAEQTGSEVYARNDLDRGHLVRRRDPGWGSVEAARDATAATFFYPNAAPQAAGFNQSKELWLGLEDHVLAYAEMTAQRVSVFTAPILAADDPPYRGIRVPLRFWKIAGWHGPAGLAAAGFVLDQSELVDTREATLVVPPLGAFRTFQVPIADIAAATGLDLGPLVEADVRTRPGAREPGWRILGATEDIVL
jgi:endonuclease G